jgi:hypothetical protein
MATIDIHFLSAQERLALIGELWDSLEGEIVPLTRRRRLNLAGGLRRRRPT